MNESRAFVLSGENSRTEIGIQLQNNHLLAKHERPPVGVILSVGFNIFLGRLLFILFSRDVRAWWHLLDYFLGSFSFSIIFFSK